MKVKRKVRQPPNPGTLSAHGARKAAKSGNWFKRLSTFVIATSFAYYNKFITWRHSIMDGLP
jgi:hypothetical protein